MNNEFLDGPPEKFAVFLRLGCNTGHQLDMPCINTVSTNLTDIELQFGAANLCTEAQKVVFMLCRPLDLRSLSKPGSFDLVFTSGVLIHIAPHDLPTIMGEIHRCSSRYIWGFEYYSESIEQKLATGETPVFSGKLITLLYS